MARLDCTPTAPRGEVGAHSEPRPSTVPPDPRRGSGVQSSDGPRGVWGTVEKTPPSGAQSIPDLRPYQTAAIEAVRDRFGEGDRSTLLILPTGTGKTVIFAEAARLAVARGGRVLVLAHRGELLDQALGKLHAVGVDAAVEQAGRRAGDARVVVASVQTLRRARLAAWTSDAFSLVVVDEAHHAPAGTYRAILDHFERAFVLGVTATPDRLDGAAMGEVFDSVAFRYELRDAIRDGWLARVEAQRVRLEVNLDGVHTRAGDLDLGELEREYGTEAAVAAVVTPLRELAGDKRTILFAVSVKHATALADAINEVEPGAARMVSGETRADERTEAVAAFRTGHLRVLVNCALYTEGFDCPEVECVAIARPTKSRALYAQMLGRGTRLAPGKESVLVLDFVGVTRRHRLVTPADVLAGTNVSEAVLAEAAAREGDVLDALEEAQTAVEERERARKPSPQVARWRAELVDVFGDIPDLDPEGAPATDPQRAALERAGVKFPPEITKAAASALIDGIVNRREKGLCTYKQLRFLERRGFDARAMTFEEANERIGRVMAGWRGERSDG
jgi:superfamily II DNA or RNA helicase